MTFQPYQPFAFVASAVALTIVVVLIRQRRIPDVLWIPWLAAAIFPAILGAWTTPWALLARALGIVYEPLLLVALASLMSFALLLYLTVVVSTLMDRHARLTQEVALLRRTIERSSTPPGAAP